MTKIEDLKLYRIEFFFFFLLLRMLWLNEIIKSIKIYTEITLSYIDIT